MNVVVDPAIVSCCELSRAVIDGALVWLRLLLHTRRNKSDAGIFNFAFGYVASDPRYYNRK